MQVKDLESMRRALPEDSSMVITMNRLLRVAVDNLDEEGQKKWAGLRGQKGMNAFVFSKEDDIRESAKAYSTLKDALTVRFSWGPRCACLGEPGPLFLGTTVRLSWGTRCAALGEQQPNSKTDFRRAMCRWTRRI